MKDIITSPQTQNNEPGALFDFRRGLISVRGEKTPEDARTTAQIAIDYLKNNKGWTFYLKDMIAYDDKGEIFVFKMERGLILDSSTFKPIAGN